MCIYKRVHIYILLATLYTIVYVYCLPPYILYFIYIYTHTHYLYILLATLYTFPIVHILYITCFPKSSQETSIQISNFCLHFMFSLKAFLTPISLPQSKFSMLHNTSVTLHRICLPSCTHDPQICVQRWWAYVPSVFKTALCKASRI